MNEEEYFRKNYPDSCYGDKPLSPHWDFFQDGVEFGERQSEEKIQELEAQLAISEHDREHNDYELTEVYKKIEVLEKENVELKEKLKTAYRKGMRHMAKALKDYDRTDGAWTDYFEHTVDKVLQREQLDFEEYGTLADQLTKAKEIIKAFLDSSDLNIKHKAEEFF